MPAAPAPTAALVPAHGTDTCPPPTGWWSLACELHFLPHLALYRGDIYGSFFLQQIDWYHQRMCVFCLRTRITVGEEREGVGRGGEFHSSYLFIPANLENWNPQSGRGGRRQSGHWMTLTNSHDSQQCPLVHLLLSPRHIHICTVKQTQTYTNTYTCTNTLTPE